MCRAVYGEGCVCVGRAGSQTQFRRMFPDSPLGDGGEVSESLEGQQRAVLLQQDRDLRRLKTNCQLSPSLILSTHLSVCHMHACHRCLIIVSTMYV